MEPGKEKGKEPEQQPVRPILEQFKEYAETRLKLFKYEAIERGTSMVADVVTDIVIIVLCLLTFLFLSFTIALWLGSLMNSYWEGFGCVTVFYALIAIVMMVAKRGVQRPLINIMVKKLFK